MIFLPENDMPLWQDIDLESLYNAMHNQTILCAKAILYEKNVGLRFNLGGYETIMPVEEVEYRKNGGATKEAAVVTRVNKKVCFVITDIITDKQEPLIIVSRKKVQEKAYLNYIENLTGGDVIPCTVTYVDSFGVFCDVACGINALLPIDFISVSRISRPSDRFCEGQKMYACIKSVDANGKIVLSHRELLGTWQENADLFRPFTTVSGVVRSIENYGVFIELMPNLAGLREVCEGVHTGDVVSVYIKSILPDKMKVKLIVTSVLKNAKQENKIHYFINSGHIDCWKYSTDNAAKLIQTNFKS